MSTTLKDWVNNPAFRRTIARRLRINAPERAGTSADVQRHQAEQPMPGRLEGGILFATVKIEPMGAPRMTRADRWKKRKCVLRYFDFKERFRREVFKGKSYSVPDQVECLFEFAMPPSWSTKKKAAMIGKGHKQTPDTDNCFKAAADSLFDNDSGIWRVSAKKVWAAENSITIVLKWD